MSKKGDVDKILHYMEQQNRPYSVNDIFLNLHKEVGKTAVQKALDQLVSIGSIKEKTYGKQKVYVADQEKFPPVNEEEMKAMDSEIVKLQEEHKNQMKELQALETELKSLGSSMTTEEAIQQCSLVEKEIEELQEKLRYNQENIPVVSPEEVENIIKKHSVSTKEWRKRKRLANDVLDAILEGWPKSKKELYEQIGIETDEDAGVTLSKT